MTRWNSLYWWSESSTAAVAHIHAYLTAQGYTSYTPFGRLPGASYPDTLKTFVAPAQAGWVRVLVDGDTRPSVFDGLAAALSVQADCLAAALDGKVGLLHAYRNGQAHDLAAWLGDHTHASPAIIERVLRAEQYDLPPLSAGQIGDVPLEDLPPDVRDMATQVNAQQANSMFEKLSKRFMQAVGRGQGRSLLQNRPDWDSQGGQYIRAVLSMTTIPPHWRTPDFATLRSAYAVQSRRADSAKALALPGDDQAAAAVPDALTYMPVYGGKSA